MTPTPRGRRVDDRGQATVELALVLPVVVVVLLLVVQVGLIARDRVATVHAAREAARAVAVDPSAATARRAVERVGPGRSASVVVGGDLDPGGFATVTVVVQPTAVPIIGRVVAATELRERFVVRVEGP